MQTSLAKEANQPLCIVTSWHCGIVQGTPVRDGQCSTLGRRSPFTFIEMYVLSKGGRNMRTCQCIVKCTGQQPPSLHSSGSWMRGRRTVDTLERCFANRSLPAARSRNSDEFSSMYSSGHWLSECTGAVVIECDLAGGVEKLAGEENSVTRSDGVRHDGSSVLSQSLLSHM